MAKKRKGSRSAATTGSKKASGAKKKTSKPKAASRSFPKKPRTGLESYKQVDFNPLKTQLKAHIDRLGKVKDPTPAVANALRSLRQVSDELSVECLPTMILPTA